MENIQPTCTVGDLVMVKGFGNRVWRVDSSAQKKSFKNGDSKSNIEYILSCVVSSQYHTTEQDNIILVCKSAFATTYLDRLDKEGKPPMRISEDVVAKSSRSQSPIKYSQSKRMDEILDEMSKILSARDLLGELSDDLGDDLYICEEELYQLGEKYGWFK